MLRGLLAVALTALLATAAAAPAALAAPPVYKGASANGDVVFFESEEQLVSGDTDTKRDVYERSYDTNVDAYVTRLVSLGPTGGNDAYEAQFDGASKDGERVFFSTEEGLVAGDTDRRTDVYMRDLKTASTTLVSQGAPGCAPCGNGGFSASFFAADAEGEAVYFTSDEKLAPGDDDTVEDLYVRHLPAVGSAETELVSTPATSCSGTCGSGEFQASPRGISADGSHAYFVTAEQLSSADTDSAEDIYAHALGGGATTTLVSTGECTVPCGNSGKAPVFSGSSSDGDTVFFSTDEQLADADHDTATDVYARDLPASSTTLISGGSANVTAKFAAASAVGTHVFFTTAEALDGSDVDSANDVYEWTSGSGVSLVTPAACTGECGASFNAVSENSSQLVFSTAEPLASGEDTDTSVDVYRQQIGGGAPVLVSGPASNCPGCGNGTADAHFSEASADASHVAFTTTEGLVEEDEDGENDIYLRDVDSPATSLITTSPSYCPRTRGNCGATFAGASSDGLHVFFSTVERFTLDDGDNEVDVYERSLESPPGEITRLISTGNDPNLQLGPPPPLLETTDPASPAASTTPRILGQAEAGSQVKVYATSDCHGEPVATGTAEQLASPGLAATVAAASLTTFRATAEAEGFVSECSGPLAYLEDSEAPGGGSGGGGSGGGSPGGGIFWITGGGPRATTSPPKPAGPTYVTPRTRITFAPAAKTRSRNPVFRFTDSTGQAGTRFKCKLDRGAWRSCGSPLRLRRLARGRHVLEVLATNAVGAVEPAAARRAFKVVPR